jgi:uncharacterized protein YkwD
LSRFQVSLFAALIVLATATLPSQTITATSAFNEQGISGGVEAGLVADEGGTVVAASLSATSVELALFEFTNAERARAGIAPLSFSDGLIGIARERASSQLGEPSLTHLDPSGQLAFTRMMRDSGIVYDIAGENLARVPAPAADAAERADYFLMQSALHRANILDSRYTSMAVGTALDASGAVVFAQIFHTPN